VTLARNCAEMNVVLTVIIPYFDPAEYFNWRVFWPLKTLLIIALYILCTLNITQYYQLQIKRRVQLRHRVAIAKNLNPQLTQGHNYPQYIICVRDPKQHILIILSVRVVNTAICYMPFHGCLIYESLCQDVLRVPVENLTQTKK